MDRWNTSYSATVHYSSNRGCFLFVPDKWLKKELSLEILVFKILYGENKVAYLSCQKYRSNTENEQWEVQINARFAEKLGIKENEKVFLQPFVSHLPKANKILLEPLTEDDWEMLELNAYLIEADLMNQIRTVWKGQVFPVWVQQCSFYVKIAETSPDHVPVLLGEFTEVHIVPKTRTQPQVSTVEDSEGASYSKLKFLRYGGSTAPKRSSSFDDGNGYFVDSDNKSAAVRAFSMISSWFSASPDDKGWNYEDTDDVEEFEPLKFEAVLRVVPYSNPSSKNLPLVVQATTVFISAESYVLLYGSKNIPPCFVAVLEKVQSPDDKSHHRTRSKVEKEPKEVLGPHSPKDQGLTEEKPVEMQEPFDSVVVTVMVVQSMEEDEFNLPSMLFHSKNIIIVPKELKRCLNLEVASLVHLKNVQLKPVPLSVIVLHPVSSMLSLAFESTLGEYFSKWAFSTSRKQSTYIISSGTLVRLHIYGKKQDFFARLVDTRNFPSEASSKTRTEPEYAYLTSEALHRSILTLGSTMCNSILVDRPYLKKCEGLYQEVPSLRLEALGGVSKLASKMMEDLEFWLKLRPLSYMSNHSFTHSGCMLVCGPKGVGKSALASAICKKLVKHPYHVHMQKIHCIPLKGKRVDKIAKMWNEIVSQAIHCQPSVILFEDLDYIASCPVSPEQESGPDGVYFSSVVQAFVHTMNRVVSSESRIAVMVTAQSTHTLHPSLVHTKGRHIFQSIVEIHPPDLEQRSHILSSLVCSKAHISQGALKNLPWSEIAAKTEGYVALDLDSLVDRATHAAWVRLVSAPKNEQISLVAEDFDMALEGSIPSSLRGIPLQIQDQRTWKDIGGLNEVKKVIRQIIMWPIKYKEVFKNYSLKPQTNILLYGAPGTGKTVLAGAIANECGLNFISIKGPELLSKYIGASEQAVRDLFKRASTARPCILFFDEFDSIAPRRGHDSTGVTDRVVNQLLTQLDGVEVLEGVHVVAATSRPELIDPALLRPGRLDKCLLCPLPNEEERAEILQCLSSKLPLCEEVDFEPIASQSEHFSGADLQALLYTAHIKALHDSSSRRYSTCSDDLSYSDESEKLLFLPHLEDGLAKPSYEDGKKIIQEVSVMKEKLGGGGHRRKSTRRNTLNISIGQRHLVQVLAEMNPSVSPQERLRYQVVFQQFRSSLSGEAAPPSSGVVKRVTLA